MGIKSKLDVLSEVLQPLAVGGNEFAVNAMLRLLEAEDPQREATRIADEIVDAIVADDDSAPGDGPEPDAPDLPRITAVYDPQWARAGIADAERHANQGRSA